MGRFWIEIIPASNERFFYLDRTYKEKNVIFNSTLNEFDKRGENAKKEYQRDLEKYSVLYRSIEKRKLPKNTHTLLEAKVKLGRYHNLKDLEKITKILTELLGVKIYQMAVHKDEGVIVEKKPYIDYHGHILFSGLIYDEKNKKIHSVKRYLNKYKLKTLQEKVKSVLKKSITDLNDIEFLIKENKNLKDEVERLREENTELKMQVNELMEKINKLTIKLAKIKGN